MHICPETTTDERRMLYIPALNGLRGLCVLCVLIFHARMQWIPGGFLAVDIFFVLSGFLITALLLQEHARTGAISLVAFYSRRAARLFPALLLACGAFVIALTVRDGLSGLNQATQETLLALLYLSNWARAFEWNAPYFLGHTWSLSIEEQFYLLWPIGLLLMLRHLRINPWFSAIAVAVAIALGSALWRAYLATNGASPNRLYNGLDTRLDGLMIGSALGVLWARGHIARLYERLPALGWQILAALALALMLWFIASMQLWLDPRLYSGGMLHLYQWVTALFLLGLLGSTHGVCQRLFTCRPALWLGTISYGAYIWHFPIYRMMQDAGLGPLQVLLYGGSATLLLSHLSWVYLENPIIKRVRKKSDVAQKAQVIPTA